MKLFFAVLASLIAVTGFSQNISEINTSSQASQYAKDHMWAEVVLLSNEDCKYIMNPDGSKEVGEPQPGAESVVRNTAYKIIADTELVLIQCAVIDFDTRNMSIEQIDSVRNLMVLEFRRHNSFEQLAKDHLSKDEMYRYQEFRTYTHQIEEMLDDDFSDRKEGELFFHELSRSDNFKFLVFIRKDPKLVDGFIVLKVRLEDN